MRYVRLAAAIIVFATGCDAPDREEDAALTGAVDTPSDPSERFTCGCPDGDLDAAQPCDLEAMRSTFDSCDEGFTDPCPRVVLDCDDVPIDPVALKCVLEELAAGGKMLYSVTRAPCEDREPYSLVMRVDGAVAGAFGLECHTNERTQIPFEAMFSLPAELGACLNGEDTAARYGCLAAAVGFAEPHGLCS